MPARVGHDLRAWTRSLPAAPVGLLGSFLVAAGGLFLGRLAMTPGARPLVALQAAPQARTTGFTLVFGGLFLLTLAWLGLGDQLRGTADGVRRVWRAAGLWCVPLLVTPPLFSNDVWSYVAEGDLVAQHRSPYVFTPLDLSGPIVHAVGRTWAGVHSPYGPLPLIWGGAVSHVSMDPWVGLLGFRVLALTGFAAVAACVPRIARSVGRDPASATWLVVACPFTLAQGVAGAHLDLVVAGLLCLALLRALRGGWVIAALLVGAATAVKAPALLLDAAVVLASLPHAATGIAGLRARVGRAVEVLALSAGTVLALGAVSGLGTGWVGGLLTPLRHLSPLSPSTEVGLRLGTLLGLRLVMPAHVVGAVLLLLVAVGVVVRWPARSSGDVVRAAAAVMSATVLLSPVVHYWYFLWCLPFLACAVLPRRYQRVTLAVTLTLGLLAPVDLSHHHLPDSGRIMLLALGAALLTALDPRDVSRLVRRGRAVGQRPPRP